MRVTAIDAENWGRSRDNGRSTMMAKTMLRGRSAVGIGCSCCAPRSLALHEHVDTVCEIVRNCARCATATIAAAAVRDGTYNRVDPM